MKTVLITGVAGLLGAHLSRHLLDGGFSVIGIDDLSGGFRGSVDKRVKFYAINLSNQDMVNHIFNTHKPHYVYHLAAYAAEGLSPYIRRHNYINNVVCSANVINACVNYDVKKIIFTSSMAVYGTGNPPFTEDQLPSPEDPYGVAKYAVEMDLKLAKEHFDLDYSIVRPHNVVGVYQNIWDRYRNVIGIWIRQCMRNEPITIFGDGTQVRAFSDIKFYMKPFEKLMNEYNGEIFNIGADKGWTINEAASLVSSVAVELGYNPRVVHLEKRNEVHTAYSDHRKAKVCLEFQDNTDLEETIREMFKWAKSEKDHDVEYFDYEIEKNLYSFWKKNR